jgi:hypothetical protein
MNTTGRWVLAEWLVIGDELRSKKVAGSRHSKLMLFGKGNQNKYTFNARIK